MTRTLIRDASIVNGDGRTAPFPGDVLIADDVIVALGAVSASQAASADRVIDARGRALAPGFVDTHNHGALGGTALGESGLPRACELAILGGVTKRICGVDGLSPAPVAAGAALAIRGAAQAARRRDRRLSGRGARSPNSSPGIAAARSPTWGSISAIRRCAGW